MSLRFRNGKQRYSKEEFAQRGDELYESQVGSQVEEGNRAKYEAILAKVPDVEPEEYDKIPTV